jgi:hypothetical protein
MERKETKTSIWHLISEKEFLTWLNSIGIDTSYIDRNRPYEFNRDIIKNEIFYFPIGLLINWQSNIDNITDSVTNLTISDWNNGFSSEVYISIDKLDKERIRVVETKGKVEKNTEIISKFLDIKIIEEFLFKSFPGHFRDTIRDTKINKILKDES